MSFPTDLASFSGIISRPRHNHWPNEKIHLRAFDGVLWGNMGHIRGVMKNRNLDDWIQSYMQYSSFSEAPDKFHFWTAVSTIAGALRRRVWIDQAYFQWTPNFYIIFVAPPGIVSKSTTLSIGMRLLRQIPGIHFGPDAVTWQALTEALANSTEEVNLSGGTGTSTPTLSIEVNLQPMSCITIASSEFGTFLNPKDREMVDVLVSLWDGQLGVWEKRTKTQGSDLIANPWINIAACTTPAWIAGNFPDYMIGGGFTSRCVFVYAENKRKLVAYPGNEIPDKKKFVAMEKDLVHDLEAISLLCGEFTLSKAATEFGEAWYESHYSDANNNELATSRFAGYLARKQTHIHKLAMVLAVSDASSTPLVIERRHLEAASEITTSIEADMPLVFSQIGLVGITKHADDILQLIKVHGEMERKAIARHAFNLMGPDELGKALESLIGAGYAAVINREGKIFYKFLGDPK